MILTKIEDKIKILNYSEEIQIFIYFYINGFNYILVIFLCNFLYRIIIIFLFYFILFILIIQS